MFYPLHSFAYFTINIAFRFNKGVWIVMDVYFFGNPVEMYFDIFGMSHGGTNKIVLDICANKLETRAINDTVEKNFRFQEGFSRRS